MKRKNHPDGVQTPSGNDTKPLIDEQRNRLMAPYATKNHRLFQWIVLLLLCAPWLELFSVTLEHFYDATGQLIKTVDSEGNGVEYVYDETGNRLEVRRATLSDLEIFDFTPKSGPPLSVVQMRGRGFSPVIADNQLTINGVTAQVTEATEQRLSLIVPLEAQSGPFQIDVGGKTTQSTAEFVVEAVLPIIESLSPGFLISAPIPELTLTKTLSVTGLRLNDVQTFVFEPRFSPPALTVMKVSTQADGRSASLDLAIAGQTGGTFTLIATNPSGSSDPFPTQANSLLLLDGSADEDGDRLPNFAESEFGTDPFKRDSDNDGYDDVIEILESSDPTNPVSLPSSLAQTFISVFNLTAPKDAQGRVMGRLHSLYNTAPPLLTGEGSAISPLVGVENTAQ